MTSEKSILYTNEYNGEVPDESNGDFLNDSNTVMGIDVNTYKNIDSHSSYVKAKEDKENDYDTDIEFADEDTTSYDHTGRTSYIKHCRREGVIPAGYFLRHMHDQKLNMRHHGLGLCGLKPICHSLITNSTITSLDLTDNWLGDESVSYLMAMMKENCFISDLILANNNLTSKSAEMISFSLAENMQLRRLDLSLNQFDDKCSAILGDLLIYSPKLEYLNLSKNQFGLGCLASLGKALGQSNNIEELDLSWNHIGGKETKQFAAGMIENTSIKRLDLSWNGFGCSLTMQDLGKMLKSNATLEDLDLSNNRVTPEGAVLLGRGLTANSTLKHLKIGQNPMQTAGCYAILNSIFKNSHSGILSLDFEDIRVNQDFLDLKSNCSADLFIFTGSRKPLRPSSCIHPVKRLKTFIRKHGLSITKYFDHFDDAESFNLTANDFKLSLQYFCRDTKFEMTEMEINVLITYLDRNQNGYINYKDFVDVAVPLTNEIYTDFEETQIDNVEN